MSVSIFLILLFLSLASDQASSITDVTKTNHSTFSVEGRITFGHNPVLSQNWQSETRVSLDYGKYIGFIKYQIYNLKFIKTDKFSDRMEVLKSMEFLPGRIFWK
jgi:hypothetical protein